MSMSQLHNHTDQGSNLRFLDVCVKTTDLIDYAASLGMYAVAITEHESLSSHIKAMQHVKARKEKGLTTPKLILGNEIYLITARGDNFEFFKGSEEVTKKFLEDNNIKYTKIIFNAINKAQICLDNEIDIMIDDSIEHCEDVKNTGIKSILFTSNVNKETYTTVERVDSWLDLEKKITLMNK